MNRVLAVLAAFFLAVLLVSAQRAGLLPALSENPAVQETKKEQPKPPSELKIPPEEVKRANPVKATAESIAAGKHTFGTQCAMCHGETGDGKGDLAVELKLKTKDCTDPATLKERTDGELFYILTKGHGYMPGQEGRMKDDQKWNLVNYVRSFAKKPEAEKPKQ